MRSINARSRRNLTPDTPQPFTRAQLSRAAAAPGRPQLELRFGDRDALRWTRGELLIASLRFLKLYRKQGLRRGDVVLIALPYGPSEIPAFLGAMLGGLVPACLPPIRHTDNAGYGNALREMIARIGAEAVVLDSATGDRDDSDREALGVCVITDELADEVSPVDTSELPDLTGDDLALIQFTTGATGRAKGAALTHRAVCNQVRHYAQAMATDDADVIVLPLRLHDNAALMAGLLQAIMTGAELVLVSPHAWVNRPVALLEAITQRRGTLCWMPNYAVALLADRVPAAHRVGCDLSSLRSLINCTDLCRADTMWSFAARYQPCGLDPAALGIAYTMAENGFAVAQTSLKCPPRVHRVAYRDLIDHHRIVDATGEAVAIDVLACGRAIDGTSIRIVDEAGRPAQDRQVGEIAVRGDAMFAGYARTETAVEHDHDGWQYTGDLGYLRDGDLYVLGRKSDGIVVGERTVYPQPIEAVASSVEGVHEGRVVALGLPDHQGGTDRLVILFEPEDENQADITLAEIERRATQADCPVDAVVPVPRKWLMKTVAGRMARGTNRNRYLAMLDDETADRPKIKHPQRLRIMSSTTTHA